MANEPHRVEETDLRSQVRKVLGKAWDCTETRAAIASLDKHETYVGRVSVMVLDGKITKAKIVAYLSSVASRATPSISLAAVAACCNEAAEALIALRPRFSHSREAAEVAWCRRLAGLIVDELVRANIVTQEMFDSAEDITSEEILVRLALGDRPPMVPDNI